MICQGCGHNYPSTITRCPKCRLASNRRGQRSSDSRLIEFPKKSRVAERGEHAQASLPPWRAELNEKVRAIQARRNNPALQTQTVEVPQTTALDVEPSTGAAAVRQPDLRSRSRVATSREMHSAEPLKQQPGRADHRSSDTIVEAALTRVRRASENASRAALPKIEPVRPMAQTAPLGIDKEATARALEPSPEITQQARPSTMPLPDIAPSRFTRPEFAEEPQRITRRIEPDPAVETEDSFISVSEKPTEASRVIVLDEDSPLDYLEAEIRKVDQVLSAELSRNDSPSLFTHVVINAIDLFTIAICSMPFLALIGLNNGAFALNQTRAASIVIISLIAFFYLSLTQCLCGKTFGMMFTNTSVIDARTAEPVTPQRALWRSAGYLLSVALAMIGLVWIALNRKRRGLHDLITDTQVASDF
ncbi:MAG: RDD family protein [Blastocatellia bacterium]